MFAFFLLFPSPPSNPNALAHISPLMNIYYPFWILCLSPAWIFITMIWSSYLFVYVYVNVCFVCFVLFCLPSIFCAMPPIILFINWLLALCLNGPKKNLLTKLMIHNTHKKTCWLLQCLVYYYFNMIWYSLIQCVIWSITL